MRHIHCNDTGDILQCHDCPDRNELRVMPARKKDRYFIGHMDCIDNIVVVNHATCDMTYNEALSAIDDSFHEGDCDD